MISISKVKEAQELLNKALLELKEETIKQIKEVQPMEGVKPLGNNAVVVSFSALQRNGWSPSTYIPSAQINAVTKAVENVVTFDALVKKINEMVEKKCVKNGNNTIYLNEKTLEILKSVLTEVNK